MKKRIISLLLALSMMISLVPVSALANTGGGIAPLAAGESVNAGHGLTINANGVPDTSGMTPDAEGVYHGNNWTYGPGGRYDRLTLTSGEWDFSNTKPADGTGSALSAVNCIVQINDGATVKGGTFNIVVNTGNSEQNIKGGIIAGGTFNSSVNNCGGTIKDGKFAHCVNDNLGDAKGIIEGGTFASNGDRDSVTNYGIISGGTFNGLVTSYWKGVIEKGTFNGKVSNYGSISGGYFLSADNKYDTDGKVSGGVFKTIPSKVESTGNLYKVQFDSESGAETTNTLSVDNHDFGMTSVYVVGTDDTELTVTAKDKILTSVNNKANTTKLGEVKLADEKDGEAYLLKLNAKLYNSELEIGADGKPVTENREPYGNSGVQGNGWTYNTKTDTLTILTGHTERFAEFGVNNILKVNVVVQKGATVERGWFYKTVENHGTMSQAYFCGNVTNTGDGTMKKCTFLDFNFTGNLTITNEGEMEECIVMKDVTMLTNNGKMIRSSVGAKTVQGNGTYDICLLAKNYEIAGTHKVTTKNETDKVDVRLVNSDGNECYTEGEETKVYFTGTPTLKVQIRRYDDGHMARIPLTNVNGDENYGIIPLENNFYIFAVPAEGDVILNDTVKHTLTLQFAEIVNDDGTTPTSGTYVEGEKIRIRPNFGTDSEKVFDGWMSEDINVNTEIVYDAETNTYILTMPGKNATVDAKYKDKAPTTYTLTLTDATANPDKTEYEKGDEITLTAKDAAEGEQFNEWKLDGLKLKENNWLTDTTIVVTITGNATAKATYKNKTYKLTLETDGTEGAGIFYSHNGNRIDNDRAFLAKDDTAELKADVPEGKQFDRWELSDGLTLVDGSKLTDATIKIKMPGKEATAKAFFKDKASTTYTLTVDGGYIGDDETKTSGEFEANAEIKVTAKAKTGYHFTKWTVEKGNLNLSEEELEEKLKANPLTFEMPDGALSLKANYEEDTPDPDDQPKTYTVTVKGGKINGETEVKAEKDTKLTVDVDETEVPEGMTFDVWSIRFSEGEDTLTPSVKLHDPHMDFTMPGADITIEAQYRSSELPGEDDGPSALGTMATVAVGGAAAGILVWQGVSLGVDSYLQLNLPKGVAVPANRRELVVLLWETAGKPEAALPSLYSDVPAEEIELQKATRWAIDNGLVKPADDSDASRFDPDRYVTKYDVFGAWLKLKKLMKL